jgi:hypothetical protein
MTHTRENRVAAFLLALTEPKLVKKSVSLIFYSLSQKETCRMFCAAKEKYEKYTCRTTGHTRSLQNALQAPGSRP